MPVVRRSTLVFLSVALVAGACSTGSTKDAAKPTTTRPTATPTAAVTPAVTTTDCPGIGTVPNEPQVTVVHGDGLYALGADGEPHCLLRRDGVAGEPKWAPTGNRVLFGGQVHYASGRAPTDAPRIDVTWSRPRGASFVHAGGDRLLKFPAEGEPVSTTLTSAPVDSFAYHPAGKHIAFAADLGGYGVYIAGNDGLNPTLITQGETATKVTEMAFSQDGQRLYFVATHDDRGHLHLLDLNTAKIQTLAEDAQIRHLHVSPIGGVAWTSGECGGDARPHVMRQGKGLDLPRGVLGASVVGWTTPTTITFLTKACSRLSGAELVEWAPGSAVRQLDAEVASAAIRMPLPPAPGPPPSKVFDIPESAAPA